MPGLLKKNPYSSSSESDSSTDNEVSGSNEPYYKDGEYTAASYPGYNEKPLKEQLEPIAVCGMGMSSWLATDPGLQMLCSMSFARRC
jgi:hypothetical protein